MRTREEIKTALNNARTTLVQAIGSANYASAAITSERIDTLTWVLNDENNPVTLVNIEPQSCTSSEPRSATDLIIGAVCTCIEQNGIRYDLGVCKFHNAETIRNLKKDWAEAKKCCDQHAKDLKRRGSSPDQDSEETAEEHF